MRIHLMTECPSGRPQERCRSQSTAAKGEEPHRAGTRSGTNLDGREAVGMGRAVGGASCVEEVWDGLQMADPVDRRDQQYEYEVVGVVALVDEPQVHRKGAHKVGRQRVAHVHTRRRAAVLQGMVEACLDDSPRLRVATFRFLCSCPGGSA